MKKLTQLLLFSLLSLGGFAQSYTWNGSVNSDWSTAANWTPSGVPNSCSDDVTIPASLSPLTISTADIQIGNLNIASSAHISLTGHTLSVCADVTGPGAGSAALINGSGKLILNGTTAQTIQGILALDELVINNSVGVTANGSPITVYRGLRLQAGNLDVNSAYQPIVLISSSADTSAWINDFTSGYTGTISGNVTMQRAHGATIGAWIHQMSSPVGTPTFGSIYTNTGITPPHLWHGGSYLIPSSNCSEDSLSIHSYYSNVLSWHENNVNAVAPICVTKGWLTMGSTDTFATGFGYNVIIPAATGIVELTGSPNTGNINVPGRSNRHWSVTSPEGHVFNSGWAMVGNPYPSSLDMSTSRLSNGFDNQVQIYHPTGAYKGTYQPFLLGMPSSPVRLSPYQAFMVHKTDTVATSTFSFLQSERTTNQGTNYHFYKQGTANSLSLSIEGNGFYDQTQVLFQHDATDGFDPAFDADKFHSDKGQPTLYTLMPGREQWTAINSLPEITATTDVAMGLEPGADGSFTITANADDINTFDQDISIYLEDKKTDRLWVNLRTNSVYTFQSLQSDSWQRFVLHFMKTSTGIGEQTANAQGVKIFAAGSKVIVDQGANANSSATIKIYNMEGQQISSETSTAGIYTKDVNTASGCLIVSVTMADGHIFRKNVVIVK